MNPTTNTNGQRKSLASQIDRLDALLDGLADGLNGAVAQAVQVAVALAVREAVGQAVQQGVEAIDLGGQRLALAVGVRRRVHGFGHSGYEGTGERRPAPSRPVNVGAVACRRRFLTQRLVDPRQGLGLASESKWARSVGQRLGVPAPVQVLIFSTWSVAGRSAGPAGSELTRTR